MGITVTGDNIRIIRKDKTSQAGNPYTTYCIKVSSKQQDDSWQSCFIDCAFKKGVSVNDKAVIKIKNSFFTVNSYNGNNKLRLMITDFEVIDSGEAPAPATESVDVSTEDWMQVNADDIDEIFK